MGEVQITPSGTVEFCCNKPLLCVAMTIDEQDFITEFNQAAKVWTAAWKGTGGQAPTVLHNMMAEYPVFNLV